MLITHHQSPTCLIGSSALPNVAVEHKNLLVGINVDPLRLLDRG